jgi:hypothetical protein
MPYCSACGQEVEPQWNACPNCGHDLPEEPPVRQNTPDPAQPQSGGGTTTGTDAGTDSSSGWALGRKAAIVATILGAIAAFLPWITVNVAAGSASVAGIERAAGQEALVIAALGFIIAAWRWGSWQRRAVTVVGALLAGYSYLYTTDPFFGVEEIPAAAQQYQEVYQAGLGLYLTGAAGVIILGSTVYDTFFNDDVGRSESGGTDTIRRPSEQQARERNPSTQRRHPVADHVDTPEERAAAEAVLEEFQSGDVVTIWGLRNQVYPDHTAGYTSADEWWSEFVQPLLQNHPDVEQYDDSGARWGQAG